MKTEKSSSINTFNSSESGGFRATAADYNHIIDDYTLRMSFIKESNIKMKRI